jgi:hypothetical protein
MVGAVEGDVAKELDAFGLTGRLLGRAAGFHQFVQNRRRAQAAEPD